MWAKCLYVVFRIFQLPLILLVVMIAPNSKRSKFWQTPVNKFISSIASYFVFLFFVFLQSNMDKSEQLRGPPNTGIPNDSTDLEILFLDLGILPQRTYGF